MLTLTLNNGVQLPALGLGVFQSSPDETIAAVTAALELGYRHIDTAAAYGNEREVGQAIRNSGVPREEIFVETKIWISDYGYDETLHGLGGDGPDRGGLLGRRPGPHRLAGRVPRSRTRPSGRPGRCPRSARTAAGGRARACPRRPAASRPHRLTPDI